MRYLIIALFLQFTYSAIAQSIEGNVVDAENTPVEFASVRVFNLPDSSVIGGSYTDSLGRFLIKPVVKGDYFIKVTFAGFSEKTFPVTVKIGKNKIAPIQMEIDQTLSLDEVTASGSLDVLKAGIDKKTYSVEDDLSSKGGTVADVLNNIPSVEVDQDGNISLRGDGNVTILINGRPSAMVANDGQNILDAFPANTIERIEVVTNPSAKYDPDGTSGIINIVLKKNRLKGMSEVASITGGTGNLLDASLGLAYRNSNFNVYANYAFNYREGYRNYYADLSRLQADGSSLLLNQERDGTDLKQGHNLVVGFDYAWGKGHSFGLTSSGSIGDRTRTGYLVNNQTSSTYGFDRLWSRESTDPTSRKNIDVNLNYAWKLKDELGELSLNASQAFGSGDVEGYYEEIDYDSLGARLNQSPLNQQLFNQNEDNQTTIQADFNYVFKNIKGRMEAGVKYARRHEDLNVFSERRDTVIGVYVPDTLANFDYKYDENIYSAYGIWGQELGFFKYQVGFRFEYAEQIPDLISSSVNYKNNYFNVFPSAHVKYVPNKTNEFSLGYSKRINRAKSRQLNPFTSYADPVNLRSGNPNLKPEYIHSFDLGYSFTKKKLILSASVFYRYTLDVINRVKIFRPDNTAIVTFGNIDESQSIGFESVIIYKPTKWMKNTLSFNGNQIDYTNNSSNSDWDNSGFNWGVKYAVSFEFWKKTSTVQLNANYNGRRVVPVGTILPRYAIDASMERRFFKNKFSVGVQVKDIFDTRRFEIEVRQPGITQDIEYKWLTRRLYVTLSVNFGQMKMKKRRVDVDGGGGM